MRVSLSVSLPAYLPTYAHEDGSTVLARLLSLRIPRRAHEYGSTGSTTATESSEFRTMALPALLRLYYGCTTAALAAHLGVRVPAEDEDGSVGRGRSEAEARVLQRAHLVS